MTSATFPPMTPTEPSSPRSCDSGGVVRAHGDTWQVSTCEAATCDNGLVRPVTITCPDLPPGCVPVLGADQCCPTCQDVPAPPASVAPTAAPRTEQPATTTEPTTTTAQRPGEQRRVRVIADTLVLGIREAAAGMRARLMPNGLGKACIFLVVMFG